jgi:hypothetical protein
LGSAIVSHADLIIDSPTTNWTAISYPGGNIPDPSADQQTGSSESDLVGDIDHASFYARFDDGDTPSQLDGTLGFRVRVAEEDSPAGFSRAVFVGIDANTNGVLDLFVGVDNSGSKDLIGIWNPGSDQNISPDTTSIESPPMTNFIQILAGSAGANYDWQAVNSIIDPDATDFDIDNGSTQGGNDPTDFFLSFSLPFSEIVSALASMPTPILIDQSSQLNFVMATATQDNSLNQDLNGVDGGISSTQTWSQLGAVTITLSAGDTLPEPGSACLLFLGFALLLGHCRRTA